MRLRESLNLPQRTISQALLILLTVGGVLLSIYAAREESQQYRALERLRIGEIVDLHFAAVSEHLLERANLAKTVSRFFIPPPLTAPSPLGTFGARALGLAPDLATIGWLPQVDAADAEQVLQSLRASDAPNPTLRSADGLPIDPSKLDRPMFPVVDVEPEHNRFVMGVDAGSFPGRLAAILNARRTHEVTRTRPLRLVQAPASNALLLYAPIFDTRDRFLGVMGFGFKVEELFQTALANAKGPDGTAISVYSHGSEEPLFRLASGIEAQRPTLFERKMDFGQGELKFVYAVPRDLQREGFRRGLWMAGAGIAVTLAAVLFFGFIANRAAVLSDEVASRKSAEDRLKVLIHELNHRVRNVMAVAQAVVRLSFTPGLSLTEIQRTCEGRLQALAKAMSILTASDWKSVSLRSLVSEDILPFAGRIEMEGPDIALRARSAQTFALLFYELATNAAKHGALSVPEGRVTLQWRIDNLGSDPVFHLHWKESGGPVVEAPVRRGFGELLVRRIAPRDMGGKSEVRYEPAGFEYELEAPLRELIDTKSASKTAA
ncbi:sensor histidine kinase [Pseudorhodoplanes sp.]|uniref:sensor histidine kinase n=1 Tax=Pseudorhodoplanes sp. TaxID=1934341 RepID=UPI003D1031CE